jgi:signal transduction histidine kinase/PAS domain-containing protein
MSTPLDNSPFETRADKSRSRALEAARPEDAAVLREELKTALGELAARSAELHHKSRLLATERVRLNDVVEHAPFSIIVLRGPQLIIEAVNLRSARLLGGGELLGRPLQRVARTSPLADLVGVAREAYRNDQKRVSPRLVSRHTDESGQQLEKYTVFTVVPIHDDSGRVEGVAIYAEDVTERVAKEADERREKLKLMIEHADQVALGLFDARTTDLIQASPRYLDILEMVYGYPRRTIVGRKWRELAFIDPEPVSRATGSADAHAAFFFESLVEARTPRRLPEVQVRLGHDKQATVWDCSLTPIYFEQDGKPGPVEFVAISAVEITEQVRTLQRMEELDHLKDEFFSLASHELRTPLVPLMGYADALSRIAVDNEKRSSWDPRISEMIGKFRKQLRHLSRLTDDLLDVARLQTGKFSLERRPVNLIEVIDQAVEQARMFGVEQEFDVQAACGPLIVRGDEERLVQVIHNLLLNAVKHAPRSPIIEVRLTSIVDAPEARIEVRDHGPGIDERELPNVFRRFYQGQEISGGKGGLGLGLYIAKGIVEQHGGTISARSIPGDGATFSVRLPLL